MEIKKVPDFSRTFLYEIAISEHSLFFHSSLNFWSSESHRVYSFGRVVTKVKAFIENYNIPFSFMRASTSLSSFDISI